MATSITSPDQFLAIQLGKLHPDYTMQITKLPSRIYPVLSVTNGKHMAGTEIRLPRLHWNAEILDRLVVKMIKQIEELDA